MIKEIEELMELEKESTFSIEILRAWLKNLYRQYDKINFHPTCPCNINKQYHISVFPCDIYKRGIRKRCLTCKRTYLFEKIRMIVQKELEYTKIIILDLIKEIQKLIKEKENV